MHLRTVALILLTPLAAAAVVAGPAEAGPAPAGGAVLTASAAARMNHSAMAGMTDAEMAAMHPAAAAPEGAVVRSYHRSPDGKLPKIKGEVGPGFTISINKSSVPAGRYKFIVDDLSTSHNFHLTGAGVDKKTEVGTTGTVKWKIKLKKGTYNAVCDPHSSSMRTSLEVTA